MSIGYKRNRVALITGSARRLGKDIAVTVAEEGYDVVLNYSSSDENTVNKTVELIEKCGVRVLPCRADVSNVDEIKSMFRTVEDEYGTLDLLINNAGMFENVDFFDIDEKLFDEFVGVNLKGVLFCSIEAAKLMQKNDNEHCNIINIASLGGILNWTGYIPYCISKAGVIKFTQLAAKRLAPKILVNAIAPGTIVIENDENSSVKQSEVSKYPLKRFGNSDDITSLIRYLIKENKFITGHTFVVDGGRGL